MSIVKLEFGIWNPNRTELRKETKGEDAEDVLFIFYE